MNRPIKIKSWLKFFWIILISNFKNLKKPYKIFLVVTKSCGSKCSHCFIWKEKAENELTVQEFEVMARKLGKDLFWLNLSGGEPTDRPDLPQIIETFVKNCPNLLCINLTTNALNIHELDRLKTYLEPMNIPIIRINVSVDGPESVHDKLRGSSGGHQLAVAAISLLMVSKKIVVMASMTLYDANKRYIIETIKELNEKIKGFNAGLFHVNLPQSSTHYYGNKTNSFSPDEEIFDTLNRVAWPMPFFPPTNILFFLYRRKMRKFYLTKKSPVRCTALSGNIYVSEKGDIFPCTIWQNKIGSLRESHYDFDSIFMSDKYIKARNDVLEKKCPGCWTPCEAYASILSDLKGSICP